VIQEALEGRKGYKINGIDITNIRYADDTVLLAESEDLQEPVTAVVEACARYNMELNCKKTKVMVIEKNPNTSCNIVVKDSTLEQVDRYKYLGCTITSDGRCDAEVKERIEIARNKF